MIQYIKNKFLILAAVLMFAIPVAVPVAVSAQSPNIQGNLCQGAQTLQINPDGTATCQDPSASTSNLNTLIRRIINILSVIIGVIAVIMIIYAGFRYITSGGKQESVSAAKNTILYAVIGLVIVALAQVLVRFTLSKLTNS